MSKRVTEASRRTVQTIFVCCGLLVLTCFFFAVLNLVTGGEFSKKLRTSKEVVEIDTSLVIATAAPFTSMDPLNFEFHNRLLLNNVYEGLIQLDSSLQPKQALAVTFGMVNETTWEFRLREGVVFHDGAELSAHDVLRSFRLARESERSQLKSILSNIEDVSMIADNVVQIVTKKPDPTFLHKLATVYIFKDYDNGNQYGTGPYSVESFTGEEVSIVSFEHYWGSLPSIAEGEFRYVEDKGERLGEFAEGEIDIIRNVPAPMIDSLGADITLISQPSLEVTFLGFGFKNIEFMRNKEVREALVHALDREDLSFRFGRAVEVAEQFVSNGVIGYARGVEVRGFDIKKSKKLLAEVEAPEAITLDFDIGQAEVAKFLQSAFEKVGVVVELNPLNQLELIEKLRSGESEIYILGWKSEFGDAIDLYKVLAHSKQGKLGEFNAGHYQNTEVDRLIAESDNTFDELARIQMLQEIMKILLVEDMFGVPLFETQIIYALQNDVDFVPRIDGFIHLNEITR